MFFHKHFWGRGRHRAHMHAHFRGHFGGFGGFGGGGFRAARMFASGDIQLIVLALLAEKPRHGYEIIKALEEHSSGVYAPSPGVVYPALTYLEEMGYAKVEAEGNKKLYAITEEGKAHLAEKKDEADEMMENLARFGKKVDKFKRHFADEEAENETFEGGREDRKEWEKIRDQFHELKDELKAALRSKRNASFEEKKRVLEVLKKTIQDIRGK